MTKQHPLTEEIYYKEIIDDRSEKLPSEYTEFTRTDMRDIADWQLEQVIKWIKECANYGLEYHDHAECDRMIKHLKKAMRPQQQEDN